MEITCWLYLLIVEVMTLDNGWMHGKQLRKLHHFRVPAILTGLSDYFKINQSYFLKESFKTEFIFYIFKCFTHHLNESKVNKFSFNNYGLSTRSGFCGFSYENVFHMKMFFISFFSLLLAFSNSLYLLLLAKECEWNYVKVLVCKHMNIFHYSYS